jgi:transposase
LDAVYQRFNRWAKSSVFERIFNILAEDHDNEYMMIDATIVRAHQHTPFLMPWAIQSN